MVINNDMEEDPDLRLEDVFTSPPSPPHPAPTYVTYSTVGGTQLSIRLVGTHPLWGHHLWNAARSFASYLEEHADELCIGRNVLELGAGSGLPSIVALLCGARKVLVTDYPDASLIENLNLNIEANTPPESRSSAIVEGYIWGRSVTPLISYAENGFDVILMSDLIFNHSQHDALLDTAEWCLSRDTGGHGHSDSVAPCVLVFYSHHRPHLAERDIQFFAKAKARGWTCENILTEKFQPMFPEDPGDRDVRSTVHGWRMRKYQYG